MQEPIIVVVESGLVTAVSGPDGVPIVICDYDTECAPLDEIDTPGSSYHTLPDGSIVDVYEFDAPPVEYEPLLELVRKALEDAED